MGNLSLEAKAIASVILPRGILTGEADDTLPELIQLGSNEGVFAVADTAEEIEHFIMDFLDDGQEARILFYVKRLKVKDAKSVPTI